MLSGFGDFGINAAVTVAHPQRCVAIPLAPRVCRFVTVPYLLMCQAKTPVQATSTGWRILALLLQSIARLGASGGKPADFHAVSAKQLRAMLPVRGASRESPDDYAALRLHLSTLRPSCCQDVSWRVPLPDCRWVSPAMCRAMCYPYNSLRYRAARECASKRLNHTGPRHRLASWISRYPPLGRRRYSS